MLEHLERIVVMNGIRVGHVVDVILAPDGETVVGFDVRCGDGRRRFLPIAAAAVNGRTLEIDSPFALLDSDELDFYRAEGRTLRSRREPAA
jgi:hypothetical protein